MQDTSEGYIIDLYNKYANNKNVVPVFKIRGQSYCIRRVEKFEWGQPIFPEKDIEDDYSVYHIYNTLEEAQKYIKQLRYIEGMYI